VRQPALSAGESPTTDIYNNTTSMNVRINNVAILACLLLLISCGGGKGVLGDGDVHQFYKKGRFLVRETRNQNKVLVRVQYFDKDTIPDGALIEYNKNGKIAKWKWFTKTRQGNHPDMLAFYERGKDNKVETKEWRSEYKDIQPDCIAYYDGNGRLDTFVGNPFIKVVYDINKQLWIGVINPPNTNNTLMFIDSLNGKLANVIFYNPQCTDTLCWVGLDEYKALKGHKYELSYFFEDSLRHPLFSVGTRIQNDAQ
jgi:hypothetical protein